MFKIALCAAILAIAYAEDGIVYLMDPTGKSGVTGTVRFLKLPSGINVIGDIRGLTPGKHGFHIHQEGNIQPSCLAAGGHFNPFNKQHGGPDDSDRHVGDLGNIEADQNGVAHIDFRDTKISFEGATSILGRSIVVHEKVDDLGKGGHPDSLKTGNAGGRLACGVVGVVTVLTLSAGGHFNPFNKQHGGPEDSDRHVGDLGNIEADQNGVAVFDFLDTKISFDGMTSILGRSAVVHEKVDDLGKGGHPDSLKTGNAGGRLACGVVGVVTTQ
uniref:Superoxide dismutase [Cu-Zn] n=1 Tax=Diabrotica virgifera virgifera TaxID=50390 RepID=A0A6P7HCF4_DIAVI